MHKACEVSKAVCREAAEELVARNDDGTMMQFCAGDGTPIKLSDSQTSRLLGGRLITRFGNLP